MQRFPITKNWNNKEWIVGDAHLESRGTTGVDDSIEFDPDNYDEDLIGDPETQKRGLYIDSNGNIKEADTGATIRPDNPKQKVNAVAKQTLNWDTSKRRGLRNDPQTNFLFDLLEERNFKEAEDEFTYLANNTDLLTTDEANTFIDALKGQL